MKMFPIVRTTWPLALLLCCAMLPLSIWAQCPNDNTAINTNPSNLPCPGGETLITGMEAGQFIRVNVVSGNEYTFETCDLSDSGFDTEMTIYRDDNGLFIDHNDDDCGTDSRITFTATFTGVVRVLIDKSGCISGGPEETGILGTCSAAQPCDITSVTFNGQSTCNDNGTPSNPSDDFFTANVVVNFVNPPATGNLQIEPGGDAIGTYSIPVGSLNGNTHTFTNVQLKADGTQTVIEVEFTVPSNLCVQTVIGPIVPSCSNAICDITSVTFNSQSTCNDNGTPSNPSDDFFTANVVVNFVNPPATGNLQIEPGGDAIGTYSIPVGSLNGNTHTFTNVQLKANGTQTVIEVEFTIPSNLCVQTVVGPTVASCSSGGGNSCEIIGFSFANIGPCNDNGTPSNPADDFFEVDVDVLYSNSFPASLSAVQLVGTDVIGTFSQSGQSGTNLTASFVDVKLRADGQTTDLAGQLFVNFVGVTCSLPGTGPAVNSCSNGGPPCSIMAIVSSNIGPCNNNGTQDPTDDFFTTDLTITFQNPPATGLLEIIPTSDFVPGGGDPDVPVGDLVGNSHTFTGIRYKANGLSTTTGARFTADQTCFLTFNDVTLDIDPCPPPANDLCANATPLPCNSPLTGTTVGATIDGGVPICGSQLSSKGVWYSFTGDGNLAFVRTCATANSSQINIQIYEGSCNSLTCVGVPVAFACGGSGAQRQLFQTTAGTQYLVLVKSTNQVLEINFTIELRCIPPLPPNGAATVNCPGNATTPVPPVYSTGTCDPDVPIQPVLLGITNSPSPISCEGTRTFTYRYTDCNFISQFWEFTYTIERQPFTVPANGASTVACPNLAGFPLPPTVTSQCGEVLVPSSPVITDNPATITCEGTRTFTFTYTDCEGNTAQWSHVTTIERQPFTITTPNGATTVNCPANLPTTVTPPTVTSNCGETLTPTGPVITNTPATITCEGSRTFTFTYTDCEGNTATWSHVFTVERQPFTVPANGASTVSCPALIVQPTPPTVLSNCGEVLTPTGPVIVNSPNPITCEGTRTFTWTFTDCEGNTAQWSHVTTIEREPFTIPVPNGTAFVGCPDDTDVQPTPPIVLSACGETLTPVLVNTTAKPGCEGHRVYTFRYTDCEGNTADWLFTYQVEYQDFAIPANETESVECPSLATQPTPPVVFDNCGKLLTPTGPVITRTDNAQGCEASRQYAWTYKDCEGNTHVWSKTYQFFYSADFFVFNDETSVVACLAYAVPPIPPTFYDACGNEIKAALTNVTEDIAASGCKGWRRFEFSYTDCGGHSHPWSFTYEINDNEAPLGTCAASNGGPVTVNVDDLSCIEDVPCPDDYDFSSKIEELLVAGDFFDVCSGDDLIVELQASSDLWACSDPDGDGVYTFGRTFHFRIADPCGNEYPGGCSVTYSGECLPIETFRQEDWGIAGDLPGNAVSPATTDLAIIDDLLTNPNGTNNPLVIGGSHRSMTLTEAQCIVDLLPGTVWPAPLANCHQTNCSGPTGTSCNPMGIGGMKNSLAANAIALTLNLRFNNKYNGLAMNELRNQSLGCLDVSSYIAHCPTEANCQLRLFDGNGTAHSFSYTLGGLLDLANLYLDGNLGLSIGQQGNYGTAINQALLAVNAEWSGNQVATACGQDADVSPIGVDNQSFGSKEEGNRGVDFSLTPNPASRYVKLRLGNLKEERSVQVEVFNTLGHRVLFQDFGGNPSIEHRIELHGLKTGMYLVMVKVEGLRPFVEKLFVSDEVSLD